MAFSFGFFNSKGLDRTYTAEDFTTYLSSIICNGILDTYGDCFSLTAASTGLKVVLGRGKAWINGHYFVNDSRYSIDLTEYQDESLPRYVSIAIVCDTSESVRAVRLEIVPGTPAENPALPVIPTDGKDGRDGVDGITPDMSEYSPTSAVELMIQKITNPLSLKSHEHENQSILDNITASYTLEEQRKLAEIEPSDYATKKALTDEALAIREAMIPLTRELHSHENMAVLDLLTTEYLSLLDSLQQFEDSTKYDIQAIRESVDPVISQAHWHHNLTLLNSITAEKITKWDNFGTQINGLSTRITVYADLVENSVARIGTAEQNIESLQKQIDVLKNRSEPIILFRSGQNAMGVYAPEIGVILNNGYHLMTDFVEEHPHFCSAENDYTISYSQDDFGWDAQILTVCTKAVSLTEKSGIMISYLSGATENGSLYLVPKPEKIDVPVTIYVSSQINAGGVISLNFKWLQSESFITTVTKCDGVSDGEYFLAWVGRSNNTHPIVKRIQVLN